MDTAKSRTERNQKRNEVHQKKIDRARQMRNVGYSYRDIARAMGLPESSVRALLAEK